MRAGARKRLLNGLADHEMRAEQPHRLTGGGPHRRQPEPPDQAFDDGLGRLAGLDDAGGEAKRPGRGGHEEGVRVLSLRPIARRKLVLDQLVGGGSIRHSQQRLRQHHQREPFAGRERIGVQEVLDPAQAPKMAADGLDQATGAPVDACFRRRQRRRRHEQARSQPPIGRRIGRLKCRHGGAALPRIFGPIHLRPPTINLSLAASTGLARAQRDGTMIFRWAAVFMSVQRDCCDKALPCSFIRHVLC